MGQDEREGELIYENNHVQIRATRVRGANEHDVWIGEHYFLFQRGCLREFAEVTDPARLRGGLRNYDPQIPFALDYYGVSEHEFALCLARARIEELKDMLRQTHSTVKAFRNFAERI